MKKNMKPILVPTRARMEEHKSSLGIWMEILVLFIGIVGYLFCNTTALDMGIPVVVVVLIAAIAFALMILLCWYKRVILSILGGLTALSLLLWKFTFPLFASLWRALMVCYNYTIHLLASQPNYSDYKDYMTMDINDILKTPQVLERYFYSAIIILALIVSIFFALALFRRIPPIISFLVPAAGLIPFFFYGIVPHYIAFSLFLAALIGCYGQSLIRQLGRLRRPKEKKEKGPKLKKSKKARRHKKKISARERLDFAARNGSFSLIVTAIMLLITIGTATFIYARPIVELEQVRESIDILAEDAMNLVFAETYEKNLNVAGYLEEGEALSLEVPKWRRLKVAEVYTTTDTPVYLRYRTTLDLEDQGWMVADDDFEQMLEDRLESDFTEYTQFYEYLRLTAPGGDPLEAELDYVESEEEGYINDVVTVRPQYRASNIIGIPGGATHANPSGNYELVEHIADTTLVSALDPRGRKYDFTVTSPMLSSNVFLGKFKGTQEAYLALRARHADKDIYLNNELAYSGLVKNYYTRLPYETRNLVQDQAREITGKYTEKIEKVQALERYFRENFTYSAARRRLTREDGLPVTATDQINFFLYQNKEKNGFCTLFASSMTAMLRSLNIPARVVTGYYAMPQMIDLGEYGTALSDSAYHAWVEVYFDGIGWLPFEPTPDFGVERNYYLLDLADKGLESEYSDENVKIEFEEIEGVIIYTDVLPEPTMPEEEEERPLGNFIIPTQPNEWLVFFGRLALALLLIAAIIFGIWFFHKKTLEKLRKLPPAAAVRLGYNAILRLMQLRGFKFFEGELLEEFARRVDNLELSPQPMSPIVPILQKGLYGNVEISEEERVAVAEFVEQLDRKFFRRIDPFRAAWYALTLTKKPRHHQMIWTFK